MCATAQQALPVSAAEKRNSGRKRGSMYRSVYLSAPLSPQATSSALADPGDILVELVNPEECSPCEPSTGDEHLGPATRSR
jgi:hypothetical protein